MNFVVMFNGKPVQIFKRMHQAYRFKMFCRKEYRIRTTIESVLV